MRTADDFIAYIQISDGALNAHSYGDSRGFYCGTNKQQEIRCFLQLY